MAADRSSVYDEVFACESVFNVCCSLFQAKSFLCTCDVKKHGCWDQFDL